MSKNTLIIALGIIPLLLILTLVIAVLMQPKIEQTTPEQATPTPAQEDIYPTPENTIREFFRAIDQDNLDTALNLLNPEMLEDEQIDAYLKSFENWESVRILSLNKMAPLDELERPAFMVEFELLLKEGSQELIWQNGEQTRFFTLSLIDSEYEIIEIATGP